MKLLALVILCPALDVNENYTGGTLISVFAMDVDAGTTLTYSLSGADAAEFSISNQGVISFNSTPIRN